MYNLKKNIFIKLYYFVLILSLIFFRIYFTAYYIVEHYSRVKPKFHKCDSILPNPVFEKDEIFNSSLLFLIDIFVLLFSVLYLKYKPLKVNHIFFPRRRGPPSIY